MYTEHRRQAEESVMIQPLSSLEGLKRDFVRIYLQYSHSNTFTNEHSCENNSNQYEDASLLKDTELQYISS